MSLPILVISVIAAGIVSALVAWFFSALELGVPTTPRRIAVGATALIVFATVAAVPTLAGSFTYSVQVFEQRHGAGVPGATVELSVDDVLESKTTDTSGIARFRLKRGLHEGDGRLAVRAAGYQESSREVTLHVSSVPLRVELTPSAGTPPEPPVQLPVLPRVAGEDSRATGHGAAQGETLKVLLLPFDNKSGKPLPDLGAKAKEVLESFIVGLGGIQVVSREQLPQLQEESKLRAFYGDGDGTIDLVLVGADFVLSGVVLSYEVDRQEVEAYGLKNVKDHYRMGLTLRLVDARSGVVRFSKGFQAKHSARYAQGAVPAQPVARTLELLNDVLEQGADGLRQGLLGERTAAGG